MSILTNFHVLVLGNVDIFWKEIFLKTYNVYDVFVLCNLFLCTIIPFVSVCYLYMYTFVLVSLELHIWIILFCFCFLWGVFVCLYVWDFYFIYNNTLLHFYMYCCIVESGFSIYLYRNWRSNQQRQFIIWQTLYHGHLPEKIDMVPLGSYWSTIPFRKNQWILMSPVDHQDDQFVQIPWD